MLAYLFSPNGRFKRWQMWSVHLTIPFISLVTFFCIGTIFGWKNNPAIVTVLGLAILVFDLWCVTVATIKRYHDRNKSGWWWFISFVPVVGPLWQLIECGFLAGDEGDNDYGSGGDIDISDDLRRMGVSGEPQAPPMAMNPPAIAPQISRPTFSSGPKPMFGTGSRA